MIDPFTNNAKELLLRGKHLADCENEEAARAIALHLSRAVLILPSEEEQQIIEAGFSRADPPNPLMMDTMT